MNSIIKAIVTNNDGIHARTAAMLLNIINKYDVEAHITYRENTVNLKHIIDVIALSIGQDAKIEIIIEGKDSAKCAAELSQVISKRLGEIL